MLFNTESAKPQNRKHKGATSRNKELFYDYEAFCDKFQKNNAKTTDDCYTPEDVFQAVLKYVGTLTDLRGKRIVRPFYPDGDYTKEEYRENDVVVDNPPFSILAQIVRFYQARNVQYFLFCNGLTALSLCKYGACIVVIKRGIKFENGADININFATNLITDCYAVTAPQLRKSIEECESQDSGEGMVKYEKPDNLICVSHLQSVAQGGGGGNKNTEEKEPYS